jgi:hypothetical protein
MNGIVFIAYGKEYDKLAAHCLSYSRQFTNISFCVITNVLERDKKWGDVSNVQFIYQELPQNENRKIKTMLDMFTPYNKTLYLDCDSIIQKKGIEKIFDFISDDNIVLNIYGRWDSKDNGGKLYKKVLTDTKISLPINIYYGALVGFSKGTKVKEFFVLWNQYWKNSGAGREMPAMACAVQNSGIHVKEIGNKDKLFSWKIDKNAVIQHEYGTDVRRLVGYPDFKPFKPFDGKQ